MSIVGSPGSEDRKKFLAMCGFAVVFAGVLYYELSGSSTPSAPPPPPVIITAPSASSSAPAENDSSIGNVAKVSNLPVAKAVGTTSTALDPTLHMEAMLVTEAVEYGGNGRNIFSAVSAPAPVVIVKPIAPARPQVIAPPQPQIVRTCPPNCPPPPPIDLKFIGTLETPPGSGHRQAFVLHGDDVWVASAGDIVLRRYRILSISATSIQVEDMPNNNKQSLPLLAN
jgi:hypothetical protein